MDYESLTVGTPVCLIGLFFPAAVMNTDESRHCADVVGFIFPADADVPCDVLCDS
jgi:hypothetical protein